MATPPTDDEREALAWAQYPDEVSDHAGRQEDRRQGFVAGFDAGFRRQGPITEHAATYDGTYRCSVCLVPVTTEFDSLTDRARWVHVEAARDA